VADHDRDRLLCGQRAVRHQVVGLEVGQRRSDDATLVGVAGAVAVPREVLEHRQHTRVTQPLRIRAREVGHLGRIGSKRAIADHLVVGFRRDVGDRREVDRDAKVPHRLAALQRDVVHLGRRLRLRQHPR
jgi:hypothetical protein